MISRHILLPALLLLAAVAPAYAQTDITLPSDPVVLVNGTNDGDTDSGPPPVAEGVANAINDTTQKYLNFLDLDSGFMVTPSFGPSVVTGLRLYTANDSVERDPASYILEGSNNGVAGPFAVISQGPLSLPAGRNPAGTPIPDLALNYQEISFGNAAAYTTYRLTFPTLKDAASANSMQIGEVEFLDAAPSSVPRAVPTMGQWGILFLALLILGAVTIQFRLARN